MAQPILMTKIYVIEGTIPFSNVLPILVTHILSTLVIGISKI